MTTDNQDYSPRQIDWQQWHQKYLDLPPGLIEETYYFRHLGKHNWSRYLFPPSTFVPYGQKLLRELRFDNSEAALRLWGFTLSEWERIYRARQNGMKVIALMGDIGALAPLVYSFPGTVAFYPDCLWWTPFMMQSWELFDEAQSAGLGEDCCFVRAALGGFRREVWFPRPDLVIATTGATCDDLAAVIAGIENLGHNIHYFELPRRSNIADRYQTGSDEDLIEFLAGEFQKTAESLATVTGTEFDEKRLRNSIVKSNRLRDTLDRLRVMNASSVLPPIGALEMIFADFSALSSYGDPDEAIRVIEELYNEVASRTSFGMGYPNRDVRLVWATPPADPSLLCQVEAMGCRIVGSEYLINQSRPLLETGSDPFTALAKGLLNGSLMGSSNYRADLIIREVENNFADGVVISGIYGSSHCPWETGLIVKALRSRNIPVVSIDVSPPGRKREQAQSLNRLKAFCEMLSAKKSAKATRSFERVPHAEESAL